MTNTFSLWLTLQRDNTNVHDTVHKKLCTNAVHLDLEKVYFWCTSKCTVQKSFTSELSCVEFIWR